MTCIVCGDLIQNSVFYAELDQSGSLCTYCGDCYQRAVVDNVETNEVRVCECGTKNPVGEGHSSWCQIFRKEF